MKLKNVKIGVEVVIKKSSDLESIGLDDSFIGLKGVIVKTDHDAVYGRMNVLVDFNDYTDGMKGRAWVGNKMLKLASKG